MPNSLASLTDSIETNSITHTIGNLARAATTRHRHSQHLDATTVLPVPQPPQHTNVHTHDHSTAAATATATTNANRLSADYSTSAPNNFSHSPSNSSSHLDNRRNSAVGLSAVDGPINNMTIDFDGGTHVIVRPNRIIRGKVVLTAVERLYVTRIRVKVRYFKKFQFLTHLTKNIVFLFSFELKKSPLYESMKEEGKIKAARDYMKLSLLSLKQIGSFGEMRLRVIVTLIKEKRHF